MDRPFRKKRFTRPRLNLTRPTATGVMGHHILAADKCKFKTSNAITVGSLGMYRGHVQRACMSAPNEPQQKSSRNTNNQRFHKVRQLSTHTINHLSGENPMKVTITVDNQPIEMEIDTGASVSIMPYSTFRNRWPSKSLGSANCVLKTYDGTPIPIKGEVEVQVQHNGQSATLPLLVVETDGVTLLGRNWLEKLQMNWKSILHVRNTQPMLDKVLSRHQEVFSSELGKLKGHKAKIYVDPEATPKFMKARSVPYSMRIKIEQELTKLTSQGIVEPVQFADWATPIVPVIKPDGGVRLCADFKVTINPHTRLDHYPIPRIEDLFATLGSGKTYTKLDMSQAYQQVELEEESTKYTVVNTHKGLYRYNRLPFGITSAPATFQRVMEGLLGNISGVIVYLDDVLITGKTDEEHLKTLDTVLTRLKEAGLRLKKMKCSFMADSVTYLGHRIDAQGLHPLQEKVEAIQQAPPPKNVSELKAFLGLLTYYNRFLCNLSTVLSPLYRLLRKDVRFKWTQAEEQAFGKAKDLLTSSKLLVHYDPQAELVMAFDASPYGIGAVLAHIDSEGKERPIGFVSRTLTQAECNYAQMEREGLACIFGLKKFHAYLYGRSFKIYTDNLALKNLLSEKQAVPRNSSARVQRWALMLSSYDYQITFRPTFKHSNADALSRLPLETMEDKADDLPSELVLLLENMDKLPITARAIAKWTQSDPILSRVYKYTQNGWPETRLTDLKGYQQRRTELSTLNGCLLLGARVVIPPKGRGQILCELHQGHPGVCRMKSLARMHVWWPELDQELNTMVQSCTKCQELQGETAKVPLEPWKWPSRPWTRIHIDYAGPFLNHMFLIIVDAHSKWVEVFKTNSSSTATTIAYLRQTFARFGMPTTIVSDNGPSFSSKEFEEFVLSNGISHVTTAPYHPQSNGLAEKMVQTFKNSLKKQEDGSLDVKMARFLISYRSTPHSSTGKTPAELLFG